MSDQTPGTPQNPPTHPPAAPVDPAAPAAPAQPAAPPPAAPPAQAAPPPVAAQPPVPPPAAPAAAPAAPAQPAAPYVPPAAPTAYPAATGAPGGPGYGTTPGAPPPAGGYFKSGKGKTIALIVGGVVAVGVIGGVAALLAGGGDGKDEVTTTASGPQGSGVLDPEPVENTDPAPTPGETTEPAPETSAPAPETSAPAPEPEPEPAPSGDSVVIGGNIAVPVLSGWEVFGSDESAVAMGSGNDFVYAVAGTVQPSTDAGQLLSEELRTMLPAESYPDLATSDISPAEPGGSIVSLAFIEYEATWTDGQGTVPVHGVIAGAVRQDGTALLILAEHTPPKEFADIYEQALAPIVGGALSSMAGVS